MAAGRPELWRRYLPQSAQEDSSRRARATSRGALPGGGKARAVASTVTTSKDSAATSRPGYGRLLRTRGAWTFLLPGFAARQPFAMLTLSIVLLIQHTTGSYGAAFANGVAWNALNIGIVVLLLIRSRMSAMKTGPGFAT